MPIYSDVIARPDDKGRQVRHQRTGEPVQGRQRQRRRRVLKGVLVGHPRFRGGTVRWGPRRHRGHGQPGFGGRVGAREASRSNAAAATRIGLIAVAAVEVGSAFDDGRAFDAVTDRMAARTNTFGDQMDQLNDTLHTAFRNSVLQPGRVGNVLTGVTQSLHLTGQAAADVTGQIDDLNRMTGDNLNIRGLGRCWPRSASGPSRPETPGHAVCGISQDRSADQ